MAMHSCVLRPPTNRVLRDDVIGGVMQRAAGRDNSTYEARPQPPTTGAWDTRCVSPEGSAAMVDGQLSPTDRKRKRQEPNVLPASNKLMLLAVSSSGAAQYTKPEPQFKGGEQQKQVMIEWANSQRDHQREIRRLRQIRYRKKKDDYANSLEEETRVLEQQIEKLEQRRRSVAEAVPTEKTLWNVAVEYFRLFRYGLREPMLARQTAQDIQPCAQLDFLRSTMAPDVLFNAGRGVEAIMRNWKYFTLWFLDVEVELDGLKKGGADSLIASITTSFTITERSLMTVFPHLCTVEARRCRGSDGRSLADKLLGRRITMRGLTRFDWDAGYGRVTSVISESDMLSPMLRILGSLEDVSRVFEKSLISLTPYRGQMRVSK
ncbi:bZIP transcription factor 1 [Phytophthora cinnamomi]|uniref:bZIP transcription factor 1 n=1 Tax=Phytophthora cinnamomi TaxID=4785 RepID=UPI002A3358AC|nr:bZIP transcription factor 1 [Phytophthora cinnamomi]KAJ8524549.1 hypothetical protein ON010_g16568 [Phytophthora cinnamomi]